jgi:hypothetical protein
LRRQHVRGREITAFVLGATKSGRIADAEPLARALETMARMYQAHAALEDTMVFTAWAAPQSKVQLDDALAEFADAEHRMFGIDGFANAVVQLDDVERRLGLSDPGRYTAPAPG